MTPQLPKPSLSIWRTVLSTRRVHSVGGEARGALTCAALRGRRFIDVPMTNLAVAEGALSLAPADRADLARLLVQGLEEDSRTDAVIKADLTRRLEGLASGRDAGLTFNEVFGKTAQRRFSGD